VKSLLILSFAGLAACATRTAPLFLPAASPASLMAQQAPALDLRQALASDPPLPGEEENGWTGLEPADPEPGSGPHDGHASGGASRDVAALLSRPLDAQSAVEVALRNNRDLRATVKDVGIARGRQAQAGLLPNPQIEAEKPLEPEILSEFGVEYDLTHALLTPLRSNAAAADVDAARLKLARTAVELAFAVQAAFYEAVSAEQKLTVAQRTLDALAAGRDAARALLEAGNVPALTVATQEAAYERARVLVAQLQLDVAASREALHRTLGLHGSQTTYRLAGQLAPAPETVVVPATLETQAVQASLELAETRARLLGLSRRTGLERAEGWLPDVSVAVRAGELQHADGGHKERRWAGGLALSIPLFNRNQGTLRATEAEFDGLQDRYEGMAIRVRSAAREARNRLISAHARARQYHTVILPAQGRVTEQTLLQFNAMQVGVFQLLIARRDELDVQIANIETLREFWTAAAGLEAVLAGARPAEVSSMTTQFSTAAESGGGH